MPAGLFRRDYLLNEALDLIGQRLHGRCWTGQELFARKVDPPELIQAQRKPIEAAAQANQELSESLGAENMRTVDDTLPEAMQAELQLCASTSEAGAMRQRLDFQAEYCAKLASMPRFSRAAA